MRDKRFIAEHRGGPLKKNQHYLLMRWACKCSEHVFQLVDDVDEQLENILQIGKAWTKNKASVGDARNASVLAHRIARNSKNPIRIAVARSVGHAVATAHMADHSLVAAWYALKAVNVAEKSIEEEKLWQNTQLPDEIKQLVLSARNSDRFKKI